MGSFNWNNIRAINGSQQNGFEELCVQLARGEVGQQGVFTRKGIPDAGVECWVSLPDQSEWGWQAKYFLSSIGTSQWQQIDKSVKSAIESHPKLVRYYICIPRDRSDARLAGKKSEKDRWDEHVAKWNEWSSGRNIEFIYWGASELLGFLSHQEHVGRVHFWFENAAAFDRAWFQTRFAVARSAAGPRYTPEVHIDLPIAQRIDAFERTETFRDRVKSYARTIREAFRTFSYASKPLENSDLLAHMRLVSEKLKVILQAFADFAIRPETPPPFQSVISATEEVDVPIRELLSSLDKLKKGHDQKNYFEDPLETLRHKTHALEYALRKTRENLLEGERIANSSLMIIEGDAGTGKTHLLCDVALRRIEAGCPTVLLMGKQFIGTELPWAQALQMIDLANISTEQFIGALETAAQVANCRALLIIDGINEGMGQRLWPDNLAAFLTELQRSPWIGTILSVRSSYGDIVEPSVRNDAVIITHTGFQGCEFDALKAFSLYYGLDLPSMPLLNPESFNPLYLKTLCEGLKANGQRTIPRGHSGITQIFQMYIEGINKTLARNLGFDKKRNLVCRALEDFAQALNKSKSNYLDREKASEIIDALLPGRDFENSLFGNLLAENVLLEDRIHDKDTSSEVVSLNYERFSDHLRAQALLVPCKADIDLQDAINHCAKFEFLRNERIRWPFSGLIEALCIQIPEKFERELLEMLPQLYHYDDMRRIWRQSIAWRAPHSFTDSTRVALEKFFGKEPEMILDVLLMIATLPDHPWNAFFLNAQLRKNNMPNRDAWWSILLHDAWNQEDSAVSRLVEWAWMLPPNTTLDDKTLDLTAITLCWMFTTSNRFLRDRATKALVNLLTGKIDAVVRLIERFYDVDDPYVLERLYAVAYGVAMRTTDVASVGRLAQCVYDKVFVAQEPPQHILLRDYARGTVERALFLEVPLNVNPSYIKPPYKSTWPKIPSKEEIESLKKSKEPDCSDNLNFERSLHRIFFSVTGDDFARYVIGTNFSSFSRTWLSVPITEEQWMSPREKLEEFVTTLPLSARSAWEDLERARVLPKIIVSYIDALGDETPPTQEFMPPKSCQESIVEAEEKYDVAMAQLKSELSEQSFLHLQELMHAAENDGNRQPGFDLGEIQRYILWRVFDLGWTVKRFGDFDSGSIRYRGREARKAERIGKKYQWIAYHEILALVSDHFQYRDYDTEPKVYQGPWQSSLRDIDPSCMLSGPHEKIGATKGTASWWFTPAYTAWQNPSDAKLWVKQEEDIPKVEELLKVTSPVDKSVWLNLCGNFTWAQPLPADQEYRDVEQRDIWYKITGYLVHAEDIPKFREWFTSRSVSFYGRWMPEESTRLHMFLGEHVWSPASRFFQQPYYSERGWERPKDCPGEVCVAAIDYLSETGGFDCSLDESISLYLPQTDLWEGMDLRWSGTAADYTDVHGRLTAQDPSAHAVGPSSLLIREDSIKKFLKRKNLSICWTILGERRVLGAGFSPQYQELQKISGLYFWNDGNIEGELNFLYESYIE